MTGRLVNISNSPQTPNESCGLYSAVIEKDGKKIDVLIDQQGINNPDAWTAWQGFEVQVLGYDNQPPEEIGPNRICGTGLQIIDPAPK